MNGMDVVAGVTHLQSVAAPAADMKHRAHLLHGECRTVDRPLIESVQYSIVFGKEHFDRLVGRVRAAVAETRVVPLGRNWLDPLRRAFGARVLHHDSHSMFPVNDVEITENPYPRMIHFHDGRYAFCRPDP